MNIGHLLDGRFRIEGLCSTTGGMGVIYYVADITNSDNLELVAKVCKVKDPKLKKRFKREVRLLNEFSGNGRVAQVYHFNTEHEPPYYVMPFYAKGDLLKNRSTFASDFIKLEEVLLQMIDCVSELHGSGVFHRDIKPENFLFNGDGVVVSDMGLSVEADSMTGVTSTAEAWGTIGYSPPEYLADGFKNPDASGDVFMLGKSFYVLMTGRSPLFLTADSIPPGLFHVVQRSCHIDKGHRYAGLAELKQAVVAAFDVTLGRVDGLIKTRSQLAAVISMLEGEGKYHVDDVTAFLDSLVALGVVDRDTICQSLVPKFFSMIAQSPFLERRDEFLDFYAEMVRRGNYGWSFAETIANCVQAFFASRNPTDSQKAKALDFAIYAAAKQNRFAAMETCNAMIISISDQSLAEHVHAVIANHKGTFVADIEPVRCSHDVIIHAIRALKPADT